MCQHYSSNASVNLREKIISVCNKCDQLESFWKTEQALSNTERRFEMSAKKLALDNHGQMIENYVFDYFLRQTEPDCYLYAKDGTEKKIHKVIGYFTYPLNVSQVGKF